MSDRKIGYFRLINIKVYDENKELLYEGPVDNASEEIKSIEYNKINLIGNEANFYIK